MVKNLIIVILLLSLFSGAYYSFDVIDKLKGTIVALTLQHKKQMVKTKVKERGKRLLATIPMVGLVAMGWFEKREYDEWKEENPDGTIEQYTSEIVDASKEVAGEMADEYCDDIGDSCQHVKDKINDLNMKK